MPEWSRSEVISTIALMISSLGFVVSYLSYRRATKGEQPHVWIEIKSIGIANCWLASINLKNPTKFVLKFNKIATKIRRVPIDDKQDFTLGSFQQALVESRDGVTDFAKAVNRSNHHLSMLLSDDAPIQPGSTGVYQCLLFRGRLSTASRAKFTVIYLVMDKTPLYKQLTAYGNIPSDGLTFHLQRV